SVAQAPPPESVFSRASRHSHHPPSPTPAHTPPTAIRGPPMPCLASVTAVLDAAQLPIATTHVRAVHGRLLMRPPSSRSPCCIRARARPPSGSACSRSRGTRSSGTRSEEHTSELQSRENLVCRLLLEKKKHQ